MATVCTIGCGGQGWKVTEDGELDQDGSSEGVRSSYIQDILKGTANRIS